MSPAYRRRMAAIDVTLLRPADAAGTEDAWRALAAAHFDGEIVLGTDLTTASAG